MTVSPAVGVELVSFPVLCLVFLFYFLGDILLCFRNDSSFVAGVLAFTAGHIAALVYVFRLSFSPFSLLVSLVVASAGFFLYVRKILLSSSSLKLGLIAYGAVLFFFASGAGASFTQSEAVPCLVFTSGVLLFVWSDSRIAYNVAGVRKSGLIAISFLLLSADAAVRVA